MNKNVKFTMEVNELIICIIVAHDIDMIFPWTVVFFF